MIGVTIASPDYRDLAVQAVESFQKMTGCNALIYFDTKPRNYAVKLNLGRLFPGQKQTVCFFDADTRWVKPTDLRPFENKAEFFAVRDPAFLENSASCFPVEDCAVHGMDPETYINSGFFIFNDRHLDVLDRAKQLLSLKKFNDFGEQSALNYALQELEVPVHLLPEGYNFLPLGRSGPKSSLVPWPSDLRMVHAAGWDASRKREVLDLISQDLLRKELKIQ